MPPADLARGLERDRARFLSEVMVDPSGWDIAKALAKSLRGEHGEGLRGIYRPDEGEHGHLYWWVAHRMSHGNARGLLGVNTSRTSGDVLEVEANVAANGTIYLAWGRQFDKDAPDHSPRFLAHPTIGELVDGCLARRGRQIVLTDDGIRLVSEPAADTSLDVARQERRRAGWDAIAARVELWTRSRKAHHADGMPVPSTGALRPLRHFIAGEMSWHAHPVPEMTAHADRSVTMRWRGEGSAATLTFRDETVAVRLNEQGRVRELEPFTARTRRQVVMGMPWALSLERYRSHRPLTVADSDDGSQLRVSTVPEK